jgi:mRNA interferase HicA
VKRKDLIRRIVELGAVFDREGGDHTIYRNPRTGSLVPVPRHAEINELTAKKIIRDASR